MRRELLDKEHSFYKSYPNISIFLIEEVFNDIDGTHFKFNCDEDVGTDITFTYIDNRGVQIENWCPVGEINGYVLPEKTVWSVNGYTYDNFEMFYSEVVLEKIYNNSL